MNAFHRCVAYLFMLIALFAFIILMFYFQSVRSALSDCLVNFNPVSYIVERRTSSDAIETSSTYQSYSHYKQNIAEKLDFGIYRFDILE